MKRIFKIIAIGLLFLFVSSTVGLFIFIKTFDVNRFKPQIIAAAQNALNRSVNFDDIALKISLGQRYTASSGGYSHWRTSRFWKGEFFN